ncbi:hypothetical protein BC936DRAFT_144994 [Jimgerdemannia flammicorona]|uniref:Uncharacterized protein n=1 Tax=Jimgerdemannia flammicorona TaxID=994334 RepID=A0A433DLY9_9FUNG|nr:hypothetical protein BC936DRAFT_144994 [Jimgerdemannia flammicorona]
MSGAGFIAAVVLVVIIDCCDVRVLIFAPKLTFATRKADPARDVVPRKRITPGVPRYDRAQDGRRIIM